MHHSYFQMSLIALISFVLQDACCSEEAIKAVSDLEFRTSVVRFFAET